MLFGFKWDGHMKQFLKMGKPVEEAFDANPLKEQLDEIKDLLDGEKSSPPGAPGSVPDDPPPDDDPPAPSGIDITDLAQQRGSLVHVVPKNVEEQQNLNEWKAYARRLIKEGVRVVAQGSATETQLGELLKNSAVGKLRGKANNYVLITYDIKLAGESITAPHDRMPPFRHMHLTKMLGAIGKARGQEDELDAGDVYMCFDAFRHGNEQEIQKCFKKSNGKLKDKNRRTIFIFYDQDSLAERRTLTRKTTVINQMEFCSVITKDPLDLGAETKRKMYSGTNKGDSIGPVASPKEEDLWMLPLKQKKSCYGNHRIAVGGSGADSDIGRGKKTRQDADMEPFSYHSVSSDLYAELIHMTNCKGVIDLTCSDFEFATVCLEQRVPYFGYGFTDDHVCLGMQYLFDGVMKKLSDEKSALYQARYAELLATIKDGGTPGGTPKGKGKGKGEGKGKGKGKGKAKGTAKADAGGKKKTQKEILEEMKRKEEEGAGGKPVDEEEDDEEEEEESEAEGSGADSEKE